MCIKRLVTMALVCHIVHSGESVDHLLSVQTGSLEAAIAELILRSVQNNEFDSFSTNINIDDIEHNTLLNQLHLNDYLTGNATCQRQNICLDMNYEIYEVLETTTKPDLIVTTTNVNPNSKTNVSEFTTEHVSIGDETETSKAAVTDITTESFTTDDSIDFNITKAGQTQAKDDRKSKTAVIVVGTIAAQAALGAVSYFSYKWVKTLLQSGSYTMPPPNV